MAEGDLKCVGSPFFLKKRFGVGYRLVVVKGDNCNPNNLTSLLSKYIPDIQVETDIGSELSYVLNEQYSSVFRSIFADIENNTEYLRITSYGVSLTTLEEVFLKVGSDSNMIEFDQTENRSDRSDISSVNNGLNGFDNFSSQETRKSWKLLKKFNFILN